MTCSCCLFQVFWSPPRSNLQSMNKMILLSGWLSVLSRSLHSTGAVAISPASCHDICLLNQNHVLIESKEYCFIKVRHKCPIWRKKIALSFPFSTYHVCTSEALDPGIHCYVLQNMFDRKISADPITDETGNDKYLGFFLMCDLPSDME